MLCQSFHPALFEYHFEFLCLDETLRQTVFSLSTTSCNVEEITKMVRDSYGDQTLVLMQANLMRFEDTPVTRGN